MNKKYVIKNVSDNSWISLDYHTGDEVVYVKSFLSAQNFDTIDKAKEFCFRHKLDLGNHQLFQLEVIAAQKEWV